MPIERLVCWWYYHHHFSLLNKEQKMYHENVDLGILNRLNNLQELPCQKVVVSAIQVSVFDSDNFSRGWYLCWFPCEKP